LGCLLMGILASLPACGGQDVAAVPDRLEIVSPVGEIAKGESAQLSAILRHEDGTEVDLSQATTWHSDHPFIVDCSRNGLMRALAVGRATLSAVAGGHDASLVVDVQPARLVGLRLGPVYPSQVVGSRWHFDVIGFYTDGLVADLTSEVRWSSSIPEVAALGAIADQRLTIVGRSPGHARITASLDGFETHTTINVVPLRPARMEVLLTSPLMAPGDSRPIRAVGYYDDGSQLDLSEWAAWLSSSDSAFIVPEEQGPLVRAVKSGSAVVTALFSGAMASLAIEVSAQGAPQ